MGYRLHYAQHYDPKWEGGYFNWDQEKWHNLFMAKFYDNGWTNEENTEYEVERDDVKAYIKELHDEDPNKKNEFFPDTDGPDSGYTNEQVVEILEEILTSDDDSIRIEWF